MLIHISSAAGRVTVPAMAACCASKFSLEAIADALRFELLPLGIDSVLLSADGAPGSEEVAEALVQLVEMDPAERPFRTVVGAPVQPLLASYNAAAEALRPVVAQIFNVAELAGPLASAAGATA